MRTYCDTWSSTGQIISSISSFVIHLHSCRYMSVSCNNILDLGQNFEFNLSFSLAILLNLCQCFGSLSLLHCYPQYWTNINYFSFKRIIMTYFYFTRFPIKWTCHIYNTYLCFKNATLCTILTFIQFEMSKLWWNGFFYIKDFTIIYIIYIPIVAVPVGFINF